MAYITSRNFVLPSKKSEMENGFWFNLWTKRLWPYKLLNPGDVLLWYESPSKVIRWKTRVSSVVPFEYATKKEAAKRLKSLSGSLDESQPYFVNGPDSGYCLSWEVAHVVRVDLPRPSHFRFSQTGWLKVADVLNVWPELAEVVD